MRITYVTMAGGYISGKNVPASVCFDKQTKRGTFWYNTYVVYIVEGGFTKFVELQMYWSSDYWYTNTYIYSKKVGSISSILTSCKEVLNPSRSVSSVTTSVPLATCETCPGYGVNSIHFATSANTPTLQPTFLAPTYGPFKLSPFVTSIPQVIPALQLNSMNEVSVKADSMGGAMISLGVFKRPALPCLLTSHPAPNATMHHYIFFVEDYDALKMVLLKCEVVENALYIQGVAAGFKEQTKFDTCNSMNTNWITRTPTQLANCSTCLGLGIKDVNIEFRHFAPSKQPTTNSVESSSNAPIYTTIWFWMYVVGWAISLYLWSLVCIRCCRRYLAKHRSTDDQLESIPVAQAVSVGMATTTGMVVSPTGVYQKVPTSEVEMVESEML